MCLIGATCSTFNKVSEIFHEMLRVIMCAHFINYKHEFSAKENFFLSFALFFHFQTYLPIQCQKCANCIVL